ncbi:MAG: CocE/NonD family hydrolase, partial [Gemmataceae bacterium]|nr:CocE/NonD family hydrolase [Gemmataceae bacterium]
MNLLRFVRCIANLLLVSTLLVSISQAREPAPVRMESVGVAMRDGVLLATDIYQIGKGRAPVVVMRTPYNKSRVTPIAERFAREGYIVVVQDCRGTFKSKGDLIPYNNEGQDGFDAIEWVYRQSWCNGRIGMWGSSYVGATQWQAAAEKPPGLVTISPTATWSSFYRNLYLGGAVRLSLIAKWAGGNSTKPENAKVTDQWDAALMHLPLSEMDTKIGWPIPWLTAMLTHNKPDGFWNRLNLTNQITDLDLSVLHVVGYYDFFSRESVDNFMIMQKKASKTITRKQQQLILGPWDHGTIGKNKVGDIDFGPNAIWDPVEANLDWFNRFLKQDAK